MSPLSVRYMLPVHSPRGDAGTSSEKIPAPAARAPKSHLRSHVGAFIYWVCKIGSWSYRGALHYFTLDPIADIQKCQDATDGLPQLLYDFRSRKVEEATFVRNAVGSLPIASCAVRLLIYLGHNISRRRHWRLLVALCGADLLARKNVLALEPDSILLLARQLGPAEATPRVPTRHADSLGARRCLHAESLEGLS